MSNVNLLGFHCEPKETKVVVAMSGGVDSSVAITKLKEQGYTILGGGIPREGAHGKPVVFLHPKSCNGTLIELEEV